MSHYDEGQTASTMSQEVRRTDVVSFILRKDAAGKLQLRLVQPTLGSGQGTWRILKQQYEGSDQLTIIVEEITLLRNHSRPYLFFGSLADII